MFDEWLTSSFAVIALRLIYKEEKQSEDNYNPSVPKTQKTPLSNETH